MGKSSSSCPSTRRAECTKATMNEAPPTNANLAPVAPDTVQTAPLPQQTHARTAGRTTRTYHLKQARTSPVGIASLSHSKIKVAEASVSVRTLMSARKQAVALAKEVETLQKLRRRLVIWLQFAKTQTPQEHAAVLGCMRPQSEAYWQDVLRVWKGPTGLSTDQLRERYRLKLEKTAVLRLQCLNRGVALVTEAAGWRPSRLGPTKSDLAPVRGKQWQLAAAWAGVELLADTFFPREFLGQAIDFQTEWCCRLGLESLEAPVAVPRFFEKDREVADFWDAEIGLEELLGVRSGRTWKACERWWLKKEPLTTMSSLLNATRCLRDLTMHGLLSASRVKDFGLTGGSGKNGCILDQMLIELVRIASATVRVVLAAARVQRNRHPAERGGTP